jgi:type I restriction enzyme M protein
VVWDIIHQIDRIPLEVLQETDTLGDIFEYMLSRGMSTMADEGQYYTSRQICRLAFALAYRIRQALRRPDGTLCTFGDWFCGTGGFPAEYIRGVNQNLSDVDWTKDSASIYCQDMNMSSVTTTLLNLLIQTGTPFNGVKKTIQTGHSFQQNITMGHGAIHRGLLLDYSFMNPPYGGDKSKGKAYKFAYSVGKGKDKRFLVNQDIQSIGVEDHDKVSAGVQLAMATLAPEGVCCIVLPQGFFFGASAKAVELRQKLAEEYKIHYVVDIASGSFINTGTKTSMLVFQKGVGPTEKVAFIGLDEKPLVEATLEYLRSKHYSLNYKQYLPQSAV